jgi:hypothetical protein
MNQSKENYKRLPGRARAGVSTFDPSRYQLWLGEDHLLHLSKTYFSESYKRFYFNDIQALTMTRTATGLAINAVPIIFIVFFGAPALVAMFAPADLSGVRIFFAVLSGVLAVGLVANVLLGPTCRCQLNTAVQIEKLPALGRIRTARRTLAILQSAIEEAQGRLRVEGPEASSDQVVVQQASMNAHREAAAIPKKSEPLRHEKGIFHVILFALVLIGSATVYVDFFFRYSLGSATGIKDSFDSILFLVTFVIAIVALVRQQGTDITKDLKRVTWAVFGLLIASFL